MADLFDITESMMKLSDEASKVTNRLDRLIVHRNTLVLTPVGAEVLSALIKKQDAILKIFFEALADIQDIGAKREK